MNLAQRARKAAGMNQEEFAEYLGVKQPQVSLWESGKPMSRPTRRLMGVTLKWFEYRNAALKFRDDPSDINEGAALVAHKAFMEAFGGLDRGE